MDAVAQFQKYVKSIRLRPTGNVTVEAHEFQKNVKLIELRPTFFYDII